MSRIRADQILNGAGTGAPNFAQGLTGTTGTFSGDVSIGTGTTISNPSDNEFRILTNGSEKVRLTSSGQVCIGNTDATLANADADELVVGGTTGSHGLTIVSQADSNQTGNIFWSDGTSSSEHHQGVILYNHTSNHMAFMTDGYNERLRILSTGGITFNGDTTSANALDDYEEGSWTPAISFGGGSTGMTFNHGPTGNYTKIGNTVRVRFGFRFSNRGSSTGGFAIGGLPFTGLHSAYNHSGNAVVVLEAAQNATMTMFVTTGPALNGRINTTVNVGATHAYFYNNTSVFGTVVYDV